MRITTQMLDASMKRAGFDFTRASLLDFVNKQKNSSSLLSSVGSNALSKYSSLYSNSAKKTSSVHSKTNKKIEKAADNLTKTSAKFLNTKNNIFENEDNSKEIYDEVNNLVDNYNSTLDSLRQSSSPLNAYYYQMLKGAAGESASSLKEAGITVDSKGVLSVDKDVLGKCDKDTLNKIFGSDSKFTNKMYFISQRASDNASANLSSASGQYSSAGDYYSSYRSKFDLFR